MQVFDKSTCWYRQDTIVSEMLKNYDVYFNLMPETQHIQNLKKFIEFLPPKQNVMDIGCGSAMVSILFNQANHSYIGADLDFIIEKVAKVKHPENNYLNFNVETDLFTIFKKSDVLLMNGFIDVMQYPLSVLEKSFSIGVKFIILHRQEISIYKPTQVIKNPSYGGETFHSIINEDDFNLMVKKYDYQVKALATCGFGNWENAGHSLLLQKNNVL